MEGKLSDALGDLHQYSTACESLLESTTTNPAWTYYNQLLPLTAKLNEWGLQGDADFLSNDDTGVDYYLAAFYNYANALPGLLSNVISGSGSFSACDVYTTGIPSALSTINLPGYNYGFDTAANPFLNAFYDWYFDLYFLILQRDRYFAILECQNNQCIAGDVVSALGPGLQESECDIDQI